MAKTRSERTKANKARKAETFANRLRKAAERRSKPSDRKASRNPRLHEDRRREQARRVAQKRATRDRIATMKKSGKAGVAALTKARADGERQFGERAKGYHLHQKHNGLARALTQKEFQKWQEDRSRQKKAGQDRKALADLDFITHAATGE